MQIYTYGRDNNWNYDDFELDSNRATTVLFTTTLGAMIPVIGEPMYCIADAGAMTIIWSLASGGFATFETVISMIWQSFTSNNSNQQTIHQTRQTKINKPNRSKQTGYSNLLF